MKKIITGDQFTVLATMAMSILAMNALQPVLPLYLSSIGIAPATIGFMFSVAMIGMVIGESTGGWLADKLGLKIPLSIGTIICAPVLFSFVFTKNIPAIFLIFLIWGMTRSTVFGPSRGFMGSTAPPLQKATFMGIYATTMAASRSVGTLISGFIADRRGYNWNFFIASGISLLGGAILLAGFRKTPFVEPKIPSVSVARTNDFSSHSKNFNSKPFIFQCAAAGLSFLGAGVMSFLPLLATKVVGVKATDVGIVLTIGGIVNTALLILMGRLADRKGKRILMISGFLVSACGLTGIAFSNTFPWLIVFVIINSIGGALFSPAAVALLSDTVPLHWQSTAMGIYGACEDIGSMIGSGLAGVLWVSSGPPSTFLLGAIAAVIGAVICLGFLKNKVPANAVQIL
jgi:MFS family permease